MSFDTEINDAKAKLEKALAALKTGFDRIRTGRASPAMIEHVHVEVYGAVTPLNQCASITVPEPTQLLVKPWDRGVVKAIEKALSEANLGMTPSSDGQVIRLNLPPLSQERRKQLAAQAKEECEKGKVGMRSIRRDAIKAVETKGKEAKVSEDVIKKSKEKIDALLKDIEAKAEAALKAKTDDIMAF
jgi:ribosome recycling factor